MRPTILLTAAITTVVVMRVQATVESSATRDAAEFILQKFGRSAAGETIEQVSETTTRAVAKHGEACLPLLEKTGPAGFQALEDAGKKAPDLINLYARRGDEAVWIISKPGKLAIFVKHGEGAADALFKHPVIADELIAKYGGGAIGAINSINRQNAQRLAMLSAEGSLDKLGRSGEILSVVGKWGNDAMDFIWRNKGALTVATLLGTFLKDPEIYIKGGKQLVSSVATHANWTLIICAVLFFLFLPFITKAIAAAITTAKAARTRRKQT